MTYSNTKQFGHISMSLFSACEILQVWFHCILWVSPHWFSTKIYILLFVVKISNLTGYKDKFLDKLTD